LQRNLLRLGQTT